MAGKLIVVTPPFIEEEHTCIWRKYCAEHAEIDEQRIKRLRRARQQTRKLRDALQAVYYDRFIQMRYTHEGATEAAQIVVEKVLR